MIQLPIAKMDHASFQVMPVTMVMPQQLMMLSLQTVLVQEIQCQDVSMPTHVTMMLRQQLTTVHVSFQVMPVTMVMRLQ